MGLTISAQAISTPIEVPGTGMDIAKNGTGPSGQLNGNDPSADFFRLQTVINAWNAANPSQQLPTPVWAGEKDNNNDQSDQFKNGGLSGFEYAVLHYGAGPGGTSGGGIEVFFLNGASAFDFPAQGSGPNGNGGFSSIVLFNALTVPDGGTTVVLLGAALSGLALLRRKLR